MDKASRSGSIWAYVTGLVSAFIATMWRLEWKCVSARILVDDLGTVVDLLLEPPASVADAVARSVDRWRLRRIAQNMPSLVSHALDVPRGNADQHEPTMLLAVNRPVAALISGRGRSPIDVPQWTAACRSQLLSAVSGGQWPQVRVASLPGTTDDRRCQLCFSAVGTLAHRRCCPAITPVEGWPQLSADASRVARQIGHQRLELLRTRGLLLLHVPVPCPVKEAAVRWFTGLPDFTRTDLQVFIDGSVKFGRSWITAVAGSAIVVVSMGGDLVAFGNARPPSFVKTAAASGLWSLFLVLQATVCETPIVTDQRRWAAQRVPLRHASPSPGYGLLLLQHWILISASFL